MRRIMWVLSEVSKTDTRSCCCILMGGFFVAWLQTQPEFVVAVLGVLSQHGDMSVVLLLFVTLFVPVLLWHKESQK